MAVIEVSTGNFLGFYQGAGTNIKVLNVVSQINFADSEQPSLKNQSLSSQLQLVHTVHSRFSIYVGLVEHTLSLSQLNHPRTHFADVFNVLNIFQSLTRPSYEIVEQSLALSQSILLQRGYGPSQSLSLTQTAAKILIKSPSIVSDLILIGRVNVYKMDKTFTLQAEPSPPAPVLVNGKEKNYVYFLAGSTTITLPRPEIGNTKRLDFTRINRRSRGGDLIVFRDPSWPKTITLALTFNWLKETDKTVLFQFMLDNLGKEVEYRDHYGKVWDGFIMTPTAQVTRESKNNRTITLEFQGQVR